MRRVIRQIPVLLVLGYWLLTWALPVPVIPTTDGWAATQQAMDGVAGVRMTVASDVSSDSEILVALDEDGCRWSQVDRRTAEADAPPTVTTRIGDLRRQGVALVGSGTAPSDDGELDVDLHLMPGMLDLWLPAANPCDLHTAWGRVLRADPDTATASFDATNYVAARRAANAEQVNAYQKTVIGRRVDQFTGEELLRRWEPHFAGTHKTTDVTVALDERGRVVHGTVTALEGEDGPFEILTVTVEYLHDVPPIDTTALLQADLRQLDSVNEMSGSQFPAVNAVIDRLTRWLVR